MTYAPTPEEFNASSDRMPALIQRFTADQGNLDRLLTAPNTPYRQRRFSAFYEAWEACLNALPFTELTSADKIDWLLLKNYLSAEQLQLEREAKQREAMDPLLPRIQDLLLLEEERRRHHFSDPAEAAQRFALATQEIERTQSQLKQDSSGVRATIANRAVHYLGQVRDVLEKWYQFRAGYDPLFTWWLESPWQAFEKTIAAYIDFLKKEVVGAENPQTIIGDPIGREGLLEELERNQIPYTPEELLTIGDREREWCLAEMRGASQEMGCGDDWQMALERIKSAHVPPGEQIVLVRDLAQEASRYVTDNDLVTVPPLAQECWRMEMMSPEMQKVNPFFLGGEEIIVSFPTNAMTQEQKRMSMRGNNPHFSRATVQHELIPGHHLQMYSMDRHRPYRQIFYTPFWIEGWTLHWEMFLWDRGFPRTPEERIGMLFWRMHRCVRVRFSLGFHLGLYTPQECVDMLVEQVGHERDNASAEVRRSFGGDYDPLYQCAYLLGGLQVHALHREVTVEKGWSDKRFHDAMLQANSMPIGLLRASLLEIPVSPEYRSDWRFYTDI